MASAIMTNPKGKVVGHVESGIYITDRNATEHFFFKYGGYSISLDILKQLQKGGVKFVQILETGNKGGVRELWSSLDDWFSNAVPYTYKGDEQRVLRISAMWTK